MIHIASWCALAPLFAALVVGLVSFAELLVPLSGAQVKRTLVSTLQTLGVPANQWKSGGSPDTILTTTAYTFAAFLGFLSQGLGAGFLETASGNWLTLLAQSVYGVKRIQASFATGALTLTNSGGGVYTYSANQATFADPTSGAQYTNSSSFTLNGGATITIPITATVAGSASSATVGTITQLVSSMLGVTCTNPSSLVGLDAMGDPELRQLCMNALGAMSVRGPRSAYAYAIQVATNPVTGAPVNINRWWISPASHAGVVTVYVASPSGAADPLDVSGIATSIEQVARPDGVTVVVQSAATLTYSATLTVWCLSAQGLQKSAVQTAVNNAISNYFANYPIGGLAKAALYKANSPFPTPSALWASGLDGAIREANPAIFAIDGTFDLAMQAAQVAVDSIVATVNLVTPSGQG